MKVWMLDDQDYDDHYIIGLFPSELKANECAEYIKAKTGGTISPGVSGPYNLGFIDSIQDLGSRYRTEHNFPWRQYPNPDPIDEIFGEIIDSWNVSQNGEGDK